MAVEFGLLGEVQARVDGRLVDLGHARQRCVLVGLLVEANRVVPVDQLIDRVWGDRPPRSARGTLHGYLSRLRQVFAAAGDVTIGRRPGGYLVTVDPMTVDLHRFHDFATQARAAKDDETAGVLFDRALRQWRGDALVGLDTPWGNSVRDTLNRQRLAAELDRNDLALRRGRHVELLPGLSAEVAAHPLDERLTGQLLLALYRAGRQAEALESYRRADRLLAEDLGIEPGPALQQLHAAILAHDPALDWTPAPTAGTITGPESMGPQKAPTPLPPVVDGSVTGARVWNIPARNPHFTGRTDMLALIRDRLRVKANTLVVQALYGLGGVGKTQLAIEYAHRYDDDYTITWLIHAEQPVLIPSQFAELANRLGLPAEGLASHTARQVLTELGRRDDWLLIFDNAGHPADIAEYLPAGKGTGHALVTSRFPGWGALGGRVEVDVLERQETMTLLRARIPEMTSDVAEQLAAELGDLPLAAAQTAAYLEQTGLSAPDYLRRFRARRADLLSRGDVLGYQGRVGTTWAMSLERLRATTPTAVALLEMSAFLAPEPIPFTLFTGLPELLDEPLQVGSADPDIISDAIGAAVELSLVRRYPDGFQLHRLVQSVIHGQLLPVDRDAYAGAVLSLLAAAHPGDPNDPTHWVSYALLSPHVLVTSALGVDRPANRQLVLDTVDYLYVRGDNRATCGIAKDLLGHWRHLAGDDQADPLRLATSLAIELASLGDVEDAHALGVETLRGAECTFGSDHPVTMNAAAAAALTMALTQSGNAAEVCSIAAHTLDRCRNALGPNHSATLSAATASMMALMWAGDAEQARGLGVDTLDRCRTTLGSNHRVTLVAATLVTLALMSLAGDTEKARSLGIDTLDRCRTTLGPNHWTTLFAATVVGLGLAQIGDGERARGLGVDTLDRCRTTLGSDHPTTLFAAAVLARALTQLGDAEQARSLGVDTLDRCRTIMGPNHPTTLIAATVLARALTQLGDAEQARSLGVDTLDRCRTTFGPNHPTTLAAAAVLARALTQVGDTEQARSLSVDTLDRCRTTLGPNHPTTLIAAVSSVNGRGASG